MEGLNQDLHICNFSDQKSAIKTRENELDAQIGDPGRKKKNQILSGVIVSAFIFCP